MGQCCVSSESLSIKVSSNGEPSLLPVPSGGAIIFRCCERGYSKNVWVIDVVNNLAVNLSTTPTNGAAFYRFSAATGADGLARVTSCHPATVVEKDLLDALNPSSYSQNTGACVEANEIVEMQLDLHWNAHEPLPVSTREYRQALALELLSTKEAELKNGITGLQPFTPEHSKLVQGMKRTC